MNTIILITVFVFQFLSTVYSIEKWFHDHNEVIVCSPHKDTDLEKAFLNEADNLGYFHELIQGKCDLAETLKYRQFLRSVIVNFDVIDFGNVNASIMNALDNHRGDIILERYGKLNDSINICDEKNNQTDAYRRGCEDPDFNLKTKIFIGSVKTHRALYNIFRTITEKSDYDFTKKIVVCANSCNLGKYKQFNLSCESCDKEFVCDKDTIAIIAPSPNKIKVSCDEDLPVIFYDTLYVEPDPHDTSSSIFDYETSTTTMHWKALSSITNDYVINKRKWTRVAIVSDDSPLSKKLTNDQKVYFTRRNILFAVRHCSEIGEFKEALSLYKIVEAAVIIVNVAKHNLAKVIQSAQALEMTHKDIIWVFPGYHENEIKSFKYSLFIYSKHNYKEALMLVKDKYEQFLGNEMEFRKAIKNHRPRETSIKFSIVHDPPSLVQLKTPYTVCNLRTNDFYYPCQDTPILYTILCFLIFFLLVFVVVVLFKTIKMNTLEYKPLHEPPSMWRRLFRRDNGRTQRYSMRTFKSQY